MNSDSSFESDPTIDCLSSGVSSALELISCGDPDSILEAVGKLTEEDFNIFCDTLESSDLNQLVYFLKYIEKHNKEKSRLIEELAKKNHETYIAETSEDIEALPYAISKFSKDEQDFILSRVTHNQIIVGCDSKCSNLWCGFDAVFGVRDRVPANQAVNGWEAMKESGNYAPELWWAGDTLLIGKNREETIFLLTEYKRIFDIDISFVTSIPPGTEETFKALFTDLSFPVFVDVSIGKHNAKRLHEAGIVNPDSFDEILEISSDFSSGKKIFCDSVRPFGIHIRSESDSVRPVGINREKIKAKFPEAKGAPIASSSLIMNPYGVVNYASISEVSDKYPQGAVVVALDAISREPLQIKLGDSIEKYLKHCVVAPYIHRSDVICLENLSGKKSVKINPNDGKIVDILD